jgi:hypothetical protein
MKPQIIFNPATKAILLPRFFFLKHFKFDNSGWGKDVDAHIFWLMSGTDNNTKPIVEYKPRKGDTFRYVHVAKNPEEYIFTDVHCHESNNFQEKYGKEYHRTKNFLLSTCDFFNNSAQTPKKKKGNYYISEFQLEKGYSKKKSYCFNLVKSDEIRDNEIREDLGGFIKKETNDIHIMEFYSYCGIEKTNKKRLLQKICNACNQGILSY